MGEEMDDGTFQQKLAQVRNQHSEKDRYRMLKNICDNFELSGAQGVAFAAECHDSDSKITASVLLYSVVRDSDKDAFVQQAMAKLFKFPEDRKELCEKLGVAYSEPEQDQSGSGGPKVSKFDKHKVSGYTV